MPDGSDANAPAQTNTAVDAESRRTVTAQSRDVVGGAPGILKWGGPSGTFAVMGEHVYASRVMPPETTTEPNADHSPAAEYTDTSSLEATSTASATTPSAPHAFFHPGAGVRRPTAERSFDLLPQTTRPAASVPTQTLSPQSSSNVDRLVVDPMGAAMAAPSPELIVRSLSPAPEPPLATRRPPPVDVRPRSPDENTPPAPGASQSSSHYGAVLAQALQPAASPAAAHGPANTRPGPGSGGPGMS